MIFGEQTNEPPELNQIRIAQKKLQMHRFFSINSEIQMKRDRNMELANNDPID